MLMVLQQRQAFTQVQYLNLDIIYCGYSSRSAPSTALVDGPVAERQ
jgi:hypothetical protein